MCAMVDRSLPGKGYIVLEILSLLSATFFLLSAVVCHLLAVLTTGDGHLGFAVQSSIRTTAHRTDITPSKWVYAIWGPIYMWQALWIVYGWSQLVCRRRGGTYTTPANCNCKPQQRTVSLPAYGFFVLACAMHIGWLFVWGNGIVAGSMPLLLLTALALSLSLAFALWTTYKVTYSLKSEHSIRLWFSRIFVHNGIAFFLTWIVFECNLQLAVTVSHYTAMTASHASTMMLALLLVQIVVWFALENTLLDRFVRQVHCVYAVMLFALSAVVAEQWSREGDDSTINRALSMALLCLTAVVQACRIVAAIVYSHARPIRFPNT